MVKMLEVFASVETTTVSLVVTGTPGGAGVGVAYNTASSNVDLANTSAGVPIEYKVGTGSWLRLMPMESIDIPIDLSASTVALRRVTYDGGEASALLVIDSVPVLLSSENGLPIGGPGGGGGGGGVNSVSVTGPLTKTGPASAPTISLPAATTAQAGHMTASQVSSLTAAATAAAAAAAAISGAGTPSGLATLGSDGLLAVAQRPPSSGGSSATYTNLLQTSVTTSNVLANITAGAAITCPAYVCNGVIATNNTNTVVEYQRAAAGGFYPIRPFETKFIWGITDASQIGFRRADYASSVASAAVAIDLDYVNSTETVGTVSHISATPSTNAGYTSAGGGACAAVDIFNSGPVDFFLKIFGVAQAFATISGTSLTRISLASGYIAIGQTITGSGVTAGTTVTGYTNGTDDGVHYEVSVSQTVGTSTFMTFAGGAPRLFKRGEVLRVNGIINSANIAASNPRGIPGSYHIERFGAAPSLPTRRFVVADNIGADAVMFQRDTAFGSVESSATLCDSIPMSKFKSTGINLALFTDSASTLVTSTAAVASADAALDTQVPMTTLTNSVVQVTATAAGTITCAPVNVPLNPVDVTGCDIHVRHLLLSGTTTQFYVDLFSTGSPSSLGNDYHRISYSQQNGHVDGRGRGATSRPIESAAAIGAGANLSAITFAVVRTISTIGSVVNPQFIKAVKKASASAKVIFTVDDYKPGAMTSAANLLGAVGYVGVCYPSAGSSMNGGYSSTATGYEALASLQSMGWQIACQDWNLEPGTNLDAAGWIAQQKKNLNSGIAMGFDPEGLRDGSAYGGGTYFQGTYYRNFHRVMASSRQFNNGSPTLGATFAGYIVGTTLTLTSAASGTIAAGAVLVADNSTGISDDQKIGALLTGTGGAIGATYSVTVSGNVGDSGSPVNFASDSTTPFNYVNTNPPGDPYAIMALNWDGSFSMANELAVYAKFKLHLDQAIAAKGLAVYATHTGWDVAVTTSQLKGMAHFLKYCKRKEALGLVENTTFMRLRQKQAAQ